MVRSLACPSCSQVCQVPESRQGQVLNCPRCGTRFSVLPRPVAIPAGAGRGTPGKGVVLTVVILLLGPAVALAAIGLVVVGAWWFRGREQPVPERALTTTEESSSPSTLPPPLPDPVSPETPPGNDLLYRRALRSTVWVLGDDPAPRHDRAPRRSGSGSFVHRGHRLVVTSYGAVGEDRHVTVFFPVYQDQKPVTAPPYYLENAARFGIPGKVVATDPRHDLALVELDAVPEGLRPVTLAPQDPKRGERILALGAAGGRADRPGALWGSAPGVVRRVSRADRRSPAGAVQVHIVETDLPIDLGDSGGPVVDDHVRLVGLVADLGEGRQGRGVLDVQEVRKLLESYFTSIGDSYEPPPPVDTPLTGKEVLVKQLGSADNAARLHAVQGLGAQGPEAQPAVPALMALLKDPDDALARAAFVALEQIGPPARNDYALLVRALKDPTPRVRVYAARTLAALPTAVRSALPGARAALQDQTTAVRRSAIQILTKYGPDERDQVLPALFAALGNDDRGVRRLALEALAKQGPLVEADRPALTASLKNPNADVRVYAAAELVRLGYTQEAQPVLVASLPEAQVALRQLAVTTLARAGHRSRDAAFPVLLQALNDPDKAVRHEAFTSLEKFGPPGPAGVPALTRALDDETADIRVFAARSLGRAGPEARSAVPRLARALQDAEPRVRREAAVALGVTGPDARAAVPALADALRQPDPELHLAVVEALGKIGPADGSVIALLAALGDPDERVRKQAAASLDRLGQLTANDVPALRDALKNPDPHVRGAAVVGLSRVGREAVPGLMAALGDGEVGIRLQAVAALGALGPDARDAVPALADAVRKDPDRKVQRAAIDALGSIGPEAAGGARALVRVLDDPSLAEPAIQSLQRIGKPAVPELVEALSHRRESVRLSAAIALGKIGPGARAAVGALTERLQDPVPAVREAAGNALREIRR